MQVFQGTDDLEEIVPPFELCESAPPVLQLLECFIPAKFHQKVDILFVIEHLLEFDDILVS